MAVIYDKIMHYDDVIMGAIGPQITSLTIVYSTVYSGADQSKHQSSASLAFVWGIHRGPVNSPHKWPVTRKMFPFDDVIMVHSTAITMVKQQSGLHSRTTPHSPDGRAMRCLSWVLQRKMTAIYRERTVLVKVVVCFLAAPSHYLNNAD